MELDLNQFHSNFYVKSFLEKGLDEGSVEKSSKTRSPKLPLFCQIKELISRNFLSLIMYTVLFHTVDKIAWECARVFLQMIINELSKNSVKSTQLVLQFAFRNLLDF